jgi:hypothetical protein
METWKDYLSKKAANNKTATNSLNDHEFVLIKKTGGHITKVHRFGDIVEPGSIQKAPLVMYYQCKKCGCKMKNSSSVIIFENKEDENVSCDYIMIARIL